eukprot:757248-Rhodomonas_salina.4
MQGESLHASQSTKLTCSPSSVAPAIAAHSTRQHQQRTANRKHHMLDEKRWHAQQRRSLDTANRKHDMRA